MKDLVVYIFIVLAFAKAEPLQAQLLIDRAVAPLNPSGPYSDYKQNSNLKGDIYQYEYTKYDRNGVPIDDNVYTDEQEAIKNKGIYERSENGLIVEINFYTYDPNSKPSFYNYDKKSRLILEDNEFWVYQYEYDREGRLSKKKARKKETGNVGITTYSYSINAGILRVDIKYIDPEGKETDYYILYEDSLELERSSWRGLIKYEYTFDEKGNWLTKDFEQQYSETRPKSIMYYSDFEKLKSQSTINFIKRRLIPQKSLTIAYPTIGKRELRTISSGARDTGDGVIFFIPQINHYYHSPTGYKDKDDDGATGIAQLRVKGETAVVYNTEKFFKPFEKGRSLKKNSNLFGNSYVAHDTVTNTSYLVKDFRNSNNGFLIPEKREGDTYLFGRDRVKETYIVMKNAVSIDYKKLGKSKFTENGDKVLVYDGKPWLILPNYDAITDGLLDYARLYAGEPLIENNPNAVAQKKFAAYQEGQPVFIERRGENEFYFFQGDESLASPDYFNLTPKGKDVLGGYGNTDFVIKNLKDLPYNKKIEAKIAAKNGELLVEYREGALKYFYNYGKSLLKEDYKIFKGAPGKWMVYLNKFNAFIYVDKEKPGYSGFLAAPLIKGEYFVYKSAKGISLLSPTGYLSSNAFTWKKTSNGTAQIFLNGKLSYELPDYDKLKNDNLYTLSLPGQKQTSSLSLKTGTTSKLSKEAQKYVEMRSLGSYKARPLFAKEIESFKADGKTQQEIDQYYLDIFNELYDHDFEEGYEFMMLVPSDIATMLISKINSEKRSAIRTRSREELKKYKVKK
ncbi:hypothetical protein BST97_05820 [Nonlabens spongiae]|uniref:Uncharacterized protein n=1 Tax=Nonlabens spongiae TaxID=331648 RepID=A0A1W6MIX3_9FLAO|nr:hypothetical protein [Nonlabens spongiae]ARN77542.1 hypothetical protein BST97_05820 [Nonlabens spongiae]